MRPFFALSLATHAIALVTLPRIRLPRQGATTPVEIVLQPHSVADTNGGRERERVREGERERERDRARERARARLTSTSATTSSSARSPSPSPLGDRASPPAPGSIDLFPAGVIGEHAAVIPKWGGKTRRPGDATIESHDGEDAAALVRKWTGELAGGVDARSGRVAPAWRDVERQIDAGFHPAAAQITDDGALRSLGKQYWRGLGRPPVGGTTPRGVDPSVAARADTFVADQIAACQRNFAEPGEWRRVEIEVSIDAAGLLTGIRVVLPSGRGEIDRLALDAVRRAVSLRPVRDPKGAATARWAVEAAVQVTPPTANPIVDPVSGKVTGAAIPLIGFSFDESLRTFGLDYPFHKQVRTRVSLLSITIAP
jgi:TonB family protein